jgi:hypothetical protein
MYSHDFLLGILEAVCTEVHRLHLSDGILLETGLGRVKRSDLRLV